MKDCISVALIKTSLGTRCKTYVSGLVLTAEIIINVLLTWTGRKKRGKLGYSSPQETRAAPPDSTHDFIS